MCALSSVCRWCGSHAGAEPSSLCFSFCPSTFAKMLLPYFSPSTGTLEFLCRHVSESCQNAKCMTCSIVVFFLFGVLCVPSWHTYQNHFLAVEVELQRLRLKAVDSIQQARQLNNGRDLSLPGQQLLYLDVLSKVVLSTDSVFSWFSWRVGETKTSVRTSTTVFFITIIYYYQNIVYT